MNIDKWYCIASFNISNYIFFFVEISMFYLWKASSKVQSILSLCIFIKSEAQRLMYSMYQCRLARTILTEQYGYTRCELYGVVAEATEVADM